ncbi:hypothetical protein GCM10011578_100930 [Streptomyces fuscichromogenes]|uniref:Uncharacterized protein n=1 Tax=Streptomyces fuscichromogenes TaxID=1324013 RepID=A0A918CY61_9ACTN|nr:hypothetical protein GCM10011578_100930 [Streptomyces fuscichromogenes]
MGLTGMLACQETAIATAYAQWLLSLGSEVRTIPVLPLRTVIIDRVQALVLIDPRTDIAIRREWPSPCDAAVPLVRHDSRKWARIRGW